MSKNSSAKSPQGDSIYYPDVIFQSLNLSIGQTIFISGSNWGSDTTTTYTSVVIPITIDELTGGTDDFLYNCGEQELAYDKFKDVRIIRYQFSFRWFI